jgi:diguanylate cyclase (GGDEF)-like protein/PAS domain S-box-containing protein
MTARETEHHENFECHFHGDRIPILQIDVEAACRGYIEMMESGSDVAARITAARAAQAEAQTLEGRNAFLARASLALGKSLDLQATADATARLPIPQLATCAIVDILRDDGSVRRISVAHENEEREARLRQCFEDFSLDERSPQAAVLASGSPQLGQIEDDELPLYLTGDAEAALLRELHCRTYLALPLSMRGRVLGCITLLSTGRHSYGVAEFTTSSEYARRAAFALDHALLYRDAVRARAAAEEAEAQFRMLVNGFRESEDRYRALFHDSHDAIYATGRDGRFIDANPAMLRMFGYTREELMRLNATQLYVDASERDRFRSAIEANGTVRDFEVRLFAKDGRSLKCLLTSIVRRGSHGEVIGYQGIVQDVTARHESELRLMHTEHFTRTIIASVQQGITVYDHELRYVVFNRFMEEITGVAAEDVLGLRPFDVFPHLVENGVDLLLTRALGGETVSSEDAPYRIPQTGREGWTSAVYSPHLSPAGDIIGVVGIIVDITERKRAEDQLTHNAFHDDLTGLPNRALFVDRLDRVLRHAERNPDYLFAVAFLDLDRFKVVNDSLGHLIGDALLIEIGNRLAGCIRSGDTIARLGGDEFALLLDDIRDESDATRVAERVLADLEHPFIIDGHELFSSVSIGIALSSTGSRTPEEILRDADTAMYRAKTGGRSRYELFDRRMHDRAVYVLRFETDLRRALERNEFILHYQPIVALDSGTISGFEALIRWNHAARGIIPPNEFIPLADVTGLIVPFGWWVLETACRQLAAWNGQFPAPAPLTMSVNLSAKQFLQPDLLERVNHVLHTTGLDAAQLQLEITESVLLQHEHDVPVTLHQLRERGIQLCIDDFGTGYSSLSYLHTFPIDFLKIDRSFIARMDQPGSPAIVETIVALSHNLGIHSIAEGVETAEQLDHLRQLRPAAAQGHFFAAAQPATDIERLLVNNPVW